MSCDRCSNPPSFPTYPYQKGCHSEINPLDWKPGRTVRCSSQSFMKSVISWEVGKMTHFFIWSNGQMVHPLVPQILELAAPVADSIGLEVVAAVFHTHQNPPVLRVDVRNPQNDTGLEDCERMSRALEPVLDGTDFFPDNYVLEVSSPGVSRLLTTDREFISFRGFPTIVSTFEPHRGHTEWTGDLVRRDEKAVYLNQKGRPITIPRDLIAQVQLIEGEE